MSGCWGSARDAVNRSFEVKSWLEIRGKSDDAGMKRRERVPPIRPQEECQSANDDSMRTFFLFYYSMITLLDETFLFCSKQKFIT